MESKHQGPRVRKRKLSGTKSAPNTQTLHTHTTSLSIKVRSVRSRQHRPPRSLGKQQRTGAIHITLTLNKSYTQFPVGTSKERPPGDSRRASRSDVAEGTKVPHDGLAEVPIRLDAGRHKGVARVQMAGMRPVLIPVSNSGSSASRLRSGGNVGRAARMNHGDIQQGGTMGRGKGHFNVSTCTLTANRGNANGSVTGFRSRIAACAGRNAGEGLLPVVMSTRAAAAEAIAAHGVVDVAALDVTTTKASGRGDVGVGASRAKAEVATVDEVAVGEAEIRVDRDGVQVSPRVPALETEHACAMCRRVASVEEFCSGALIECVRKGGTRGPNLQGDGVRRHGDKRWGRRQGRGLY
jgi:hypothetical protein